MEKLILVYGAGSGLGKSTIGRGLRDKLLQQGKRSRWVQEEIVSTHPAFAEYVACVRNGDGANTEILLNNAVNLIADFTTYSEAIVIVDSVFPCWDWLSFAHAPLEETIKFTEALCAEIERFRPILIVIDGDIPTALARAIEDRGVEDVRDLAQGRLGVRDEVQLVGYFGAMREMMELMLPYWPYQLIRINTVDASKEICLQEIMKEMSC